MNQPIELLICCCCDDLTVGRQWYNRDTGFGLCVNCIGFVGRSATADDMKSCYGERGVHYDIPNDQLPKHLQAEETE